jgi:hypothetical protein
MATADRLSSLPDKLLQRILFFTPPKEAASTSVLSRRWCGLWLRGGRRPEPGHQALRLHDGPQ